jgi:hypothetical protein
MGQAAGLAAALAAGQGVAPGDVDGARLRTELESRGMRFAW